MNIESEKEASMGIMQIIREYTNQIVEGNFDAAEGVCEKCHEKPGE